MTSKKPNLKLDYINKIVELGMVSDRMYDHCSAVDVELRDMETKMNPMQVKRIMPIKLVLHERG